MTQHTYILRKEAPPLLFRAPEPTTLWVDRIVFNTQDPKWSQRIAGSMLSVVMFVSEDDDEGGKPCGYLRENKSIGLLNRNTFIRPVFDILEGWAFTPQLPASSDAPHTWMHGITLGGSLQLLENESIELTIRTSAEFMDVAGMMDELNILKAIKQN